jgi:hypothetical protein
MDILDNAIRKQNNIDHTCSRLTQKLPLTRNSPVLSRYVRKRFAKASVPIMLIPRITNRYYKVTRVPTEITTKELPKRMRTWCPQRLRARQRSGSSGRGGREAGAEEGEKKPLDSMGKAGEE